MFYTKSLLGSWLGTGCTPATPPQPALSPGSDFGLAEERLPGDLNEKLETTEILAVELGNSGVPVLLRSDLNVTEAPPLFALLLHDDLGLEWVVLLEVSHELRFVRFLGDVADENVVEDNWSWASLGDAELTSSDGHIGGGKRGAHAVWGLEIDETETAGDAAATEHSGHDTGIGDWAEAGKLLGKLLGGQAEGQVAYEDGRHKVR